MSNTDYNIDSTWRINSDTKHYAKRQPLQRTVFNEEGAREKLNQLTSGLKMKLGELIDRVYSLSVPFRGINRMPHSAG